MNTDYVEKKDHMRSECQKLNGREHKESVKSGFKETGTNEGNTNELPISRQFRVLNFSQNSF